MRSCACLLLILLAAPVASAQETSDSTRPPDSTPTHRRPPEAGRKNPYLREVPDEEPQNAAADRLHKRGGMWGSIGAGAGTESVLYPGPTSTYSVSRTRPTLSGAIGGTVGQFMRIGLEGFGWFNLDGNGYVETISSFMVGARVYPLPGTGLYFHAAGGFGFYNVGDYYDPCGCHSSVISDIGGAWSLGAGLEVPLKRGVWIGPTIEVLHVDMMNPVDYRERVIHFGLSLTFDGQ
jgi:hypothetical protein